MDFFYQPETPATPTKFSLTPWNILIVDDDADVHTVTHLALRDFTFQDRGIHLISALSAQQAQQKLADYPDIAMALVDVVMETDQAGLDLVRYIRENLKNHKIRLILRTGQPGQAPEDRVIRDYEIDDYKEKTDLTTQKLRTLLYSSLRSYRDICIIEAQRDGLQKILLATAFVQNTSSLPQFASAVLEQLTSLLNLNNSALYCMVRPIEGNRERETRTLASTGQFHEYATNTKLDALPSLVAKRIGQVLASQQSQHFDDAYAVYVLTESGSENVLYINHAAQLSRMERHMLEVYVQNVAITFENINLVEDIQDAQKELVYTLADAVEARSKETGSHVKRVALITEKLALLAGLSPKEASLLKHASPLHDIGKIAIPDSILHKPGKLDSDEWLLMKRHTEFGMHILQNSKRKLMQLGGEIAISHHEKWDGSGYPSGLVGEQIPLSGRIAALADVFDALGSKRSYKEAWSADEVNKLILQERGKHFDPQLVDLLLQHFESFLAVRAQYPDEDHHA